MVNRILECVPNFSEGRDMDIIKQITDVIESVEGVRFDRAHFKGFGDSSLDFEVVYFVLSSEYGVFMDKQQEINLALFEKFEKEGIGFAYPTRTIHLSRSE